jgi:eukaryotic-like serine/threonine-protein kinase
VLLLLAACSRGGAEKDDMVLVPGGEFAMGSAADDPIVQPWEKPREQPQHPVQVAAFYIDRYEVTNAAFKRFKPDHVTHPSSACDDCPVSAVSWFEASAYCAAQTPAKRLPTEAEWEKAAKAGGDGHPQPLAEYARFFDNADIIPVEYSKLPSASPIGKYKPNALGLYDMLGNVREWTADWFGDDYYWHPVPPNPKGPAGGTYKVERGGSFMNDGRGVTATLRYNHPPTIRLFYVGFRCARDA